jgi:hypothetical protein
VKPVVHKLEQPYIAGTPPVVVCGARGAPGEIKPHNQWKNVNCPKCLKLREGYKQPSLRAKHS